MEPQSEPGRTAKTLIRVELWPDEGFIGSLTRLPHALLDLLLLWQQRASDRVHLGRLSDQDLKDVGLTRTDVGDEVKKPFWQP